MKIIKDSIFISFILSEIWVIVHGLHGNPKLPSFLKLCSKSSSNFKECLIDSIENLRPFLARGIPEFGIPSCEPLIISEVFIDQGNGPVSVKSSYRDIEVFGPSKFVVKNIKIDLDKDRVKIKLLIPELKVNTNYTMEGQILLMPITGSGQSYGNYTDIESVMTMKTQKVEKDGEMYYNVQDCYIDFNIGHASLKFTNLFNGNEELGEAMNLFLNDNWKTVVTELKPVLEDKIAEIFKKFANKIFHKYPLSMLFPE